MALYAVHLANGRTSNIGVLRLLGRLMSGSGVVQQSAFTVAAQTSPDMTVKVSGSTAADDLVIIDSSGNTYHGWNTASANVTITSNSSGVTKKDHVVAYVDTALTTATPDNPGGLVLIAVRGSGTNAPTDGEISTATGGKPWIRLAEISVANGASSINSGNITNLRTRIGIGSAGLDPGAILLGRTMVTSDFATTSSTAVQVTGMSASVTIPDVGRLVKISVCANSVYSSSAAFITVSIWDGAVASGTRLTSSTINTTASGQQLPVSFMAFSTSTGAKTFNVGIQTTAGTAHFFSDANSPASLLVELI